MPYLLKTSTSYSLLYYVQSYCTCHAFSLLLHDTLPLIVRPLNQHVEVPSSANTTTRSRRARRALLSRLTTHKLKSRGADRWEAANKNDQKQGARNQHTSVLRTAWDEDFVSRSLLDNGPSVICLPSGEAEMVLATTQHVRIVEDTVLSIP